MLVWRSLPAIYEKIPAIIQLMQRDGKEARVIYHIWCAHEQRDRHVKPFPFVCRHSTAPEIRLPNKSTATIDTARRKMKRRTQTIEWKEKNKQKSFDIFHCMRVIAPKMIYTPPFELLVHTCNIYCPTVSTMSSPVIRAMHRLSKKK